MGGHSIGPPNEVYGQYLANNVLHSLYTYVQKTSCGCASVDRVHTLLENDTLNVPNIFLRMMLSSEALKVELIIYTSHNLNPI